MTTQTIPSWIQPIVWSIPVGKLDPQKDKTYIIHQILAYGGMKEWQWLFNTYTHKEIKETFISHPYKDYRAPRFHFVINYILNIDDTKLNPSHYVKSTPRDIRHTA